MGKVVTAPINAARTTVSMTCAAIVLVMLQPVRLAISLALSAPVPQFPTDKIRIMNVRVAAMATVIVILPKAHPAPSTPNAIQDFVGMATVAIKTARVSAKVAITKTVVKPTAPAPPSAMEPTQPANAPVP